MDPGVEESIIQDGRSRPLEATEHLLAQRLDGTRLDGKVDLQVGDLEDRGIRHTKSLPK
jgi:hypothetical protein